MYKKPVAVVFGETGARILVGPGVEALKNEPNVVINPDLTAVEGLPPHKWDLKDGQIVPAAEKAAAQRAKVLHGSKFLSSVEVRLKRKYRNALILAGFTFFLAFTLGFAVAKYLERLF